LLLVEAWKLLDEFLKIGTSIAIPNSKIFSFFFLLFSIICCFYFC
jgi:hypothetical protein